MLYIVIYFSFIIILNHQFTLLNLLYIKKNVKMYCIKNKNEFYFIYLFIYLKINKKNEKILSTKILLTK